MKLSNRISRATLAVAAGLAMALSVPVGPAAAVTGAKDLFVSQLNSTGATATNLGLSYSIELRRDGKLYKVDNRFAFKSGDQIRFHVCPNVDGFMYVVLDSETGGNPTLMFPRPGDEKNAVTKGKTFTLPENGTLTFDEVPGVEALKLVLSPKPLEVKPEKMARTIIIREKQNVPLPTHFLIDFAAIDPAQTPSVAAEIKEGEFDKNPASTMVSTQPEKPLVVDLMLRHDIRIGSPVTTIASGGIGHIKIPGRDRPLSIEQNDEPAVATTVTNNTTAGENAVTNALSGSSPVSDKWAVVIGISKFKNPKWNLNFPDKDAKDFSNFLVQKCNFAPDHVRTLTDAQATRENILTDLGSFWLPFNAKPNDLVCIYFATHGTSSQLDAARVNYLMAYDTDPINGYATGIEINELSRNVLRRLKSKRVVLILDTCHSGAADTQGSKAFGGPNFDMKDLLQGTGHVVIASAGANQIAHDSARYKNGIFTKHLIDGMTKFEKLNDAFNYTRAKVQEEATSDYRDAQTPVLRDGQWKGVELKLGVSPIDPHKPIQP